MLIAGMEGSLPILQKKDRQPFETMYHRYSGSHEKENMKAAPWSVNTWHSIHHSCLKIGHHSNSYWINIYSTRCNMFSMVLCYYTVAFKIIAPLLQNRCISKINKLSEVGIKQIKHGQFKWIQDSRIHLSFLQEMYFSVTQEHFWHVLKRPHLQISSQYSYLKWYLKHTWYN